MMPIQWFGEPYPSLEDAAPIYDAEEVETPVGERCYHCEEPIAEGERGFVQTVMLDIKNDDELLCRLPPGRKAIHHECFMRMTLGSAGHILKRCSCYGGTEEDPPGVTVREAARRALKAFEEVLGL